MVQNDFNVKVGKDTYIEQDVQGALELVTIMKEAKTKGIY